MLWVPALINAFPHFQGRRGDLHKSLEELRRLRNRIAHHEALVNRDLATDHWTVLEILGYIEPDAKEWLKHESTITNLLATKP